MIKKADEFIEDAISKLDWQQMQELGRHPARDGLSHDRLAGGFGPRRGHLRLPRWTRPAGAAHLRRGQAPRPDEDGAEHVRAFLGGRKPGDKCLYVSTGSFTKEARYEAERASVPTTLLGLQDLRKLLVENYEKFDAETRALVPLKRLYWPLT